MSFVSITSKKSSLIPLATAAMFAAHLAIAASPVSAASNTISKRLDLRHAEPTTAGTMPASQITHSTKRSAVAPLSHAKSRSVATRPNAKKETANLYIRISAPTPLSSNPIDVLSPPAAATSATPGSPGDGAKVAPQVTTIAAPVATPTPLVSISKNPAMTATTEKPDAKLTDPIRDQKAIDQEVIDKKAEADKALLAQIDAELNSTQTRLDSTSQKLSAGQRQLMSLSNNLRSAIIEAGDDGEGLHPFVRVATRYAGTPYVWGGESRYGFDCSGFIIRVMRDLGYKALPHSAAEQFKYGQPVAQVLLKPGDIVFFANTYKPGISHVGIYLGKRRFIHAASTRLGTIISSLDSSPYRQKYAGARRLLTLRKKS